MALLRISSLLALLGFVSVNGQFGGMMGGMGGMGGGMGTCTFDLKCYMPRPGCSLVKETPFWRMTPISCEDCLNLCQDKMAHPMGPYCCRSVVYDAVTQTCDIFAVVSRGSANTGKWDGRIYFQPTGAPGCASNNTNTTTPAANTCKDGETAKLVAVKDYAVSSVPNGKEATGVSDADACGKACLSGKLPDGSSVACKSAQFKDGKCMLSTDEVKIESDATPAPGSSVFRVYCFPNDLVKGCPDTFIAAPQKILVGQNKLTVDKPSLDECVKACLNSQKDNGFVCKSAIFYYNDQKLNCILNTESSKTKPDLYTDAAPDDKEVYFETDCGGGVRFHDVPKKRSKAFKDALFDIPEHGAWSMWSPCHGRKSEQVRFQRCRKMDSRDCQTDTRSCDPSKPYKPSEGTPVKKPGVDSNLIDQQKKRARDQVLHAPAPRRSRT